MSAEGMRASERRVDGTSGSGPTPLSAVVLAGGESRRFGSDKTRARWGDVTLLEHVVATVSECVDRLVVIGPWAPAGVAHASEPHRGQGPLNALAFALEQVETPLALVVAADHPLLQPRLLGLLITTMESGDAEIVVPTTEHGPQPLVACYRSSLAGVAADLVAGGERRVRALFDQRRTEWIEPQRWQQVDPDGRSFMDADTPSALDALRRLDRGQPGDV